MIVRCRRFRSMMLPACSVLGVALALVIVVAWFPTGTAAWQYPLHQIDAPAHYYFIRKILDEGIGAATRLWPNDAYYPPMFHLLAAGLIRVAAWVGYSMNVYTALNLVWIVTSGVVWPAGVQLLASYWTRNVDGRDAEYGAHCERSSTWRPFSCCMAIIVPVLAVTSPCHPYWMLFAGPLIAYGLATTLLPYWLYATLRLFDAFAHWAQTRRSNIPASAQARRSLVIWLLLAVLAAGLCIFAHPRMVFTWLLFIGPFALLRLPWKLIAAMFAAVCAGAVAFFFYMTATYRSNRYLDPSSWFHTFEPNRTVPEALWVGLRENISGIGGWLMALAVIIGVLVLLVVAVRPRWFASGQLACRRVRKDAISVLMVWALVMLVYVCSTALVGWFPNIVAAAWYRAETRPLTMLPFGVLPVLVFSWCMMASIRRAASAGGDSSRLSVGAGVGVDVAGAMSADADALDVSAAGAHESGGGDDAGAQPVGAADADTDVAGVATSSISRCAQPVSSSVASERASSASRSGSGSCVVGQPPVGVEAGSPARRRSLRGVGRGVACAMAVVLAVCCQFGDTTRAELSASVYRNMMLTNESPTEQLTSAKYKILSRMVRLTGTRATIVSDPLNGSMYGATVFGANMLYPIYNPMVENNGAIFAQVEQAFNSGDGSLLLDTVCGITPDEPAYFLSMGTQAESLQMFTFKAQYDPFHRDDLIEQYVADGTMRKVQDYSNVGDYAQGWALYRFACPVR